MLFCYFTSHALQGAGQLSDFVRLVYVCPGQRESFGDAPGLLHECFDWSVDEGVQEIEQGRKGRQKDNNGQGAGFFM